MHHRSILLFATALCLGCGTATAQSSKNNAPADAGNVIRTETKLVLVDAVVTDKKGNYIRDLTAKDFRVWEDKTEQTVKSFSLEGGEPSPGAQKQYLVFFFDVTSMSVPDQTLARQAAGRFASASFGPNRMMAVADYGGTMRMTQNFTENPELLAKAFSAITQGTISSVTTQGFGGTGSDSNRSGLSSGRGGAGGNGFGGNASGGNGPGASGPVSDFAARNALLYLKLLARNLRTLPGRKALILFTGGLAVSQDHISELTAAVNACNMANVTVYTVDVHGIGKLAQASPERPAGVMAGLRQTLLGALSFPGENSGGFATSFLPQARGGGGAPGGGAPGGAAPGGGGTGGGAPGGGGRGGAPGGGTGGPSAPGTGTPGAGAPGNNPFPGNNPNSNNGRGNSQTDPFNRDQNQNAERPNQEVAHLLVSGTGGLEIRNTNDLLGGLEKIGKEQNEYYLIGYTPPPSDEESCHKLRVQVSRSGTQVRARPGYCSAKPRDLLSGKPVEKVLESRAAAPQAGSIGASMQIPYFYTSSNMARVNVAMEIPSDSLKFQKQKGKLHAAMDVLGIATTADGTIGARFSDTLKLDFDDQRQIDGLKLKPLHYENQFDIASGAYTLKIVFSAGGDSFGKLESPLVVGEYKPSQFSLSGVALSKESRPAMDVTLGLDALLIDDQTPLIANGKRIIPFGSNRFKKTDPAGFYFEIYEQLLATAGPQNRPEIGVQIRTLDRQTAQPKTDSGVIKLNTQNANENGMLPVSVSMPLTQVEAGSYLLEVQALDSAGNSVRRVTPFDVE
ncbi:MAG: VWA domain-containing protein [Acidobacteriia bacterium]|nr:VWA domain-containing protein [Terriglobia bacterium]